MVTEVTSDNLKDAQEDCRPLDIRAELIAGCKYWDIDGGWMALWPNGRGAVCFGGDSTWGDWERGLLSIDDPYPESCINYDGEGKVV